MMRFKFLKPRVLRVVAAMACVFSGAARAQCVLSGVALYNVERVKRFEVSAPTWIPQPTDAFAPHMAKLGGVSFARRECATAFEARAIRDRISGERYSAIYSSEDSCDRGNSYGFVFARGKLAPVATIQDSDFYCIE